MGERNFFKRLAESLALIPDCPRSDAAIEALAEDLLRMCETEAEASWLASEAREKWESWRGVAGLAYMLHLRRHPPLPPSNLAADDETKARWIRERDAAPLQSAGEILIAKSTQDEIREMHLKAIRDMLYYTEGEGQHGADGYWHSQRIYDLKEHPDLVTWVRNGEVGEMPPLEPMSRRKSEKARAAAASRPPVTAEDVEREREKLRRKKLLEAPPSTDAAREPGEGE